MISFLNNRARRGLSSRQWYFVVFILGFCVRSIPEVLSYPYPIGFDTVRDVALVKNGIVWYHWTSVFSTWLLYALVTPIYHAFNADPFLLLKLAAPILYGFNACGVYYFSKKALHWGEKKAGLTAFLFVFQLASLRLSWDMHRNMLGMALLLFALPLIPEIRSNRKLSLFILLSVLIVFTHELTSVVMFALSFTYIIGSFVRREKTEALRTAISIAPALLIFLLSVYSLMISPRFPSYTNIIDSQPTQSEGISFFFVNYLGVTVSEVQYSTYFDLVSHVLSLFTLLYVLTLPLVFVGFFRDRFLDYWTLFLLIGSFNSLITPVAALALWNRWMFMLVYPLTFYVVNGFEKAWVSKSEGTRPSLKVFSRMRISKKTGLAILFLMMLLASFFMTVRLGDYGVFATPTTSFYFPPTMLQNTVPLRDVADVAKNFGWLDGAMKNRSSVLVHQAFISWAQLYLGNEQTVIWYITDVDKALNLAIQHGYNPTYLIWWNSEVNWYNIRIPDGFRTVHTSGRISVYGLDFA